MAVQAVAGALVEIDDHGVLLRGVEPFGLDEQALEAFPIEAGPFHQLDAAPAIVLLLGVGPTDLHGSGEIHVGVAQVGEGLEILAGEEEPIGVAGFDGAVGIGEGAHGEGAQGSGGEVELGVAACLGHFVGDVEQQAPVGGNVA